jgi:hypothetical protein
MTETDSTPHCLPRGAATGFSIWMLFWVPVILWSYGPQNFLWICNLAQFIVLLALWTPSRLLLSSQTGTVLLVGVVWTADSMLGLASGGAWARFTDYMFDPGLPLLARAASLYHVFLPAFLIWMVHRAGYDGRGPWLQTAIAAIVLPATWLLTDPEWNVNWLNAPLGLEQVWLPDGVFTGVMVLLYPLLLFWPGHRLAVFLLARLPRPGRGTAAR